MPNVFSILMLVVLLSLGGLVSATPTTSDDDAKPAEAATDGGDSADQADAEEEAPLAEPGSEDRRRWRMDDQEIAAARQIVARLYPDLSERLEQLFEDDPDEARRTLERRFRSVRFLVHLQKHDPEMFELRMRDVILDRRAQELAAKAAEADQPDQQGLLRQRLHEALATHFDVRQKIRQREIDWLHRKVESLEDEIADEADRREALIEERVAELMQNEMDRILQADPNVTADQP